mmetsp:Transcript_18536/g.51545  ORF Transcript_18536/g.51545 Transcript_18536/m.51545 type:complete len:415 (-) Transcript_18536:9-1253(-)
MLGDGRGQRTLRNHAPHKLQTHARRDRDGMIGKFAHGVCLGHVVGVVLLQRLVPIMIVLGQLAAQYLHVVHGRVATQRERRRHGVRGVADEYGLAIGRRQSVALHAQVASDGMCEDAFGFLHGNRIGEQRRDGGAEVVDDLLRRRHVLEGVVAVGEDVEAARRLAVDRDDHQLVAADREPAVQAVWLHDGGVRGDGEGPVGMGGLRHGAREVVLLFQPRAHDRRRSVRPHDVIEGLGSASVGRHGLLVQRNIGDAAIEVQGQRTGGVPLRSDAVGLLRWRERPRSDGRIVVDGAQMLQHAAGKGVALDEEGRRGLVDQSRALAFVGLHLVDPLAVLLQRWSQAWDSRNRRIATSLDAHGVGAVFVAADACHRQQVRPLLEDVDIVVGLLDQVLREQQACRSCAADDHFHHLAFL